MTDLLKRKKAVLALVVLVVGGVLAGVLATRGSSRGRDIPGAPTGAALAAVQRAVRSFAAYNGESDSTGTQLYPTTRRNAIALIGHGADLPDDSPTYLVVVHGTFTATEQAMPVTPGHSSRPITGTVLAMVINPATDEVRGYTIRKAPIDLTPLGQGTPIDLSP